MQNEYSKDIQFDTTIELKDNSMLIRRPELFNEWNFKKNGELGLDVYKVTFGSDKIAWWNCPKCESPYDMKIESRSSKGQNCPFCSRQRINHTNSLASLNPDLASEWHPTLNGDLTPDIVACRSNKNRWWLSKECGHHWEATVDKRAEGGGCPYCAPSPKVLIGYNDMWTTNPEQANLLVSSEDGYKYTQSSNVKVDWKCMNCDNTIKNKQINTVNKRGIACARCSDGVGFPERFMYNLLKEDGIDFSFDTERDWSEGKRYDFHFKLKEETYIIEVHGIQHYENSRRGRSLIKEQENDRLKEKLAKENGIDNYIVIDARESTVEWIKNSILSSDLMDIIGSEIDFERLGQLASKSLVKIACDLWNSGVRRVSEIVKEMNNMSPTTVATYLKRGAEIGWCDYCPKEAMRKGAKIANKMKRKPVVQLDKNSTFIKSWSSVAEAGRDMGKGYSGISSACVGTNKTAGGFRWMFKEDYGKMTQEGLSHESFMNQYRTKKIS